MKRWELEVSFTTPAFLGDAFQNGAWRTPPFKALLRQWWRVAAARDCKYDVETLRAREMALFGRAAGGEGNNKSKVFLRLKNWKTGTLSKLPPDKSVFHEEVGRGGRDIGAMLYLGYGPITSKRGSVLARDRAIDTRESNGLIIWMFDEPENEDGMSNAVRLAVWFGALGSRSRNGWGSLMAEGGGLEPVDAVLNGSTDLRPFSRPLEECLRLDWPHAFGTDEKGALVWKSRQGFDSWEEAMKHLAKVKIAFRTALPVQGGFQDRHLLAYPITHHNVLAWGTQERMANQIRFKVVKAGGKHYALAYHLPCDIPSKLKSKLGNAAPSLNKQASVWRRVHEVLDRKMMRIGGLA